MSTLSYKLSWLLCHFVHICILLSLNINNKLFSINLIIKCNNLLMLSIPNIDNLHRLNLLRINKLLSVIRVKARGRIIMVIEGE